MQRSVDRGIRARSTGRWVVAAAALVVAAACGDKNFNTVSLLPAIITVSSTSNNQTGEVGQPLAQPVSVQVTDQSGNPVAGVIVTWTVLTGGGSVSQASSTTDGSGNASVIWTLGATAGENTLSASIATGASVTITATGVVTPPVGAAMTIVSGNNQTIAIGATSAPLVVMVSTAQGLGIPNIPVTWTVTGGGTISSANTTTDANGQTSVTASAAAGTTLTVTATAAGLAAAVFTVTVQ